MKRSLSGLIAVLSMSTVAVGAPNPASSGFARAVNASGAFEVAITTTPGSETWALAGQDVVPFYYEQGMASHGETDLVFGSRASLTRTSVGCAAPLDPGAPCYDAREENPTPISRDLVAQGFNHLGGIDVGPSVSGAPGAATIFAPLETDPPRTRRGYAAYDLQTLARVGLIVEEVAHRYNSWVAVDPSARFMITAQDKMDPIRVYEIGRDGAAVTLTRRADLDVTDVSSTPVLPNFQGCKFADDLTLYCANWMKRDSYFDIKTEIYRIDLSAPIGSTGVRATGAVAASLKAQPRYAGGAPYGLETEDLAFWGGQLHVTLRGEGLGWIHVVHLARQA